MERPRTSASKRPRTETSTAVLDGNEAIGQSSTTRGAALFTLEDPDLLDCPICTEPLRPPVYQCINGHYACESCCIKIKDKCPSCTLPILSIRCLAMERVVESIITHCVYRQYGCNAIVSYLEKQDHEATCQHIPMKCPNQCGYVNEPKSVYNHHAQEHSDDCCSITFGTVSELIFERHTESFLLRESEENILFSVRWLDIVHGSVVYVRCLAPPTLLDMKFSCELTVKKGEGYVSQKSAMKLDPDYVYIEKSGCFYIPRRFQSEIHYGFTMQLVIRKEHIDITEESVHENQDWQND